MVLAYEAIQIILLQSHETINFAALLAHKQAVYLGKIF